MIYVTGHKNPDTDSIAAAIAMARLKQANGVDALPVRLGKLSKETETVLDLFGFETPRYINDARTTLSETDLDTLPEIDQDRPVIKALRLMDSSGVPFAAAIDSEGRLAGLITRTDIGRIGLDDTADAIELLKSVTPENLAETLDGTIIYTDDQMELNGKVSILAATHIDAYQLDHRIVICGSDPKIQKTAIEKGAGLLILVWTDRVADDVLEAARIRHCPIIISGHGAMNTSRYLYFSIAIKELMTSKLITFDPEDITENAMKVMSRYRYRIYPVVKDGRPLGCTSPRTAYMARPRQFILVDHNEFSQSVENIEQAEILEVIDHHRIADFASRLPLNFHSEPVGSTCTIIANLFMDQGREIEPSLAGLMLAGIISDTLNFQSCTTTPKDINTGTKLAEIAQIDPDALAGMLFSQNAPLSQDDINQLICQDMKKFTIEGSPVLIAQYITASLDIDEAQLQASIDRFVRTADCSLYVLALTDISKQGSYFYKAGPLAGQLELTGELYPGVLSRKKQILPLVSNLLAK